MTLVGITLTLVGIVALIWGVMQKMKAGRIAKTPLVQTGEVASRGEAAAGPKGAVSVEGETRVQQPLISPVTGTECLYYELVVTGSWKVGDEEKSVDYIDESFAANFALDDGTGPVEVLAGDGGDFDMETTFEETKKEGFFADLKGAVGKGEPIMFGNYAFENPPMSKANVFTCVERVMPLVPHVFAMGTVQGNAVGSPSWSSLVLSSKGREELLGGAARTAKLCLISGAASTGVGAIVGAVGALIA